MTPPDRSLPPEPPVRPHTFDGIREFDQRLPNWWLFTFYAAIAFWIGCWMLTQQFRAETDAQRVTAEVARIEAAKLAAVDISKLDDDAFWKMSRNPTFTEPGKATFNTLCASCHLSSMRGKDENPVAIGPNLTDLKWIHGGKPLEIYHTVTTGVPVKGMPTWGPLLGPKKITEVVAYVLSKHDPAEVPEIVAPTAGSAVAPPTLAP